MSVTGVRCASEKLKKRREVVELSMDDCLKCAATRQNDCNYTLELLRSMYGTIQEREDRISTTVLTSPCDRSTVMERRLDTVVHPDSLWASFKGTMYHGQLEKYAEPPAIEEPRFHVHLEGLGDFSGSPDLVDVSAGVLYDYKTTKQVPTFGYVWSNHGEQLNVNRWLVDNADTVEWRGDTYDLTDPAVREFFVPKEWTQLIIVYLDDKQSKPIEATRSEQVPKADGKGTKSARVADIWTDADALTFIRERYAAVRHAFDTGEIPEIPDQYKGWKHNFCNYCAVRTECIEHHYNGDTAVSIRK